MKKIILLFILYIITSHYLYAQSDQQAKFNHAQSYEKSGDLNNAARIYYELYQSFPQNESYLSAVIRTYISLARYTELLEIIKSKVENRQSSAGYKLYTLYGELLWRTGKTKDAESAWNAVIENWSDSLNAYATVAETQYKLYQMDKAISTLKASRQHLNIPTLFSQELSQLYIATGNYQAGVDEVLSYFYFSKDIAYAQGKLYALSSNKKAEEFILSRLNEESEKNSMNMLVLELYSFFLRSVKKYDAALDVIVKIDELKKSEGRDILYFADRSRQDDEYDIAMKGYEIIINEGKSNKYFGSALYGYTKTLEQKILFASAMSKNEAEGLIKRYRNIIEQFPKQPNAAESRYRIAYLAHEYLDDSKMAIEELNSLVKEFPYLPITATGLNYLGTIYLFENDFDKSRDAFITVKNKFPKNQDEIAVAGYHLAELLYYSGNIDSAKSEFKNISMLSQLDISNDALEKLAVIEKNKDLTQALTIYAQAEFKEFQNKYDEALELYKQASEKAMGEDLGEYSIIRAAKIGFKTGNYSISKVLINKMLERYPETIYGDVAYLLLGNIYGIEGNKDAAIQNFTMLLTKYSRSVYLQEARDKIRILRGEKI